MVCQLCAKNSKESNSVFTCQEKLDKHLKLMHKESLESNDKSEVVSKSKSKIKDNVVCKHCKSEFTDEVKLKTHINSEHRIPCYICNKSFLEYNLKRHIKTQHEEKKKNDQTCEEKNKDHEEIPLIFFCNICNKEFAGPKTLKIHERTHTSTSVLDKQSDSVHEIKNSNPEISVPKIKLTWDSKKKSIKNDKGEKVKLNIKRNLVTGLIELPSTYEIEKMEKDDLKEYMYKLYEESQKLQYQLKNNGKLVIKTIEVSLESSQNDEVQTSEEPEMDPLQSVVKIKTTVSNEVTLESSEMLPQNDGDRGSRKRKSGEIDHPSPKRPKKNKNKVPNPKYFCTICKHQFKDGSNFRRHNKRKHGTGEKNFECNDCNTKFLTKEYLKKHITGVHGGKKFKCTKCNIELTTAPGLKKHLKNHDRDIDKEILGM